MCDSNSSYKSDLIFDLKNCQFLFWYLQANQNDKLHNERLTGFLLAVIKNPSSNVWITFIPEQPTLSPKCFSIVFCAWVNKEIIINKIRDIFFMVWFFFALWPTAECSSSKGLRASYLSRYTGI